MKSLYNESEAASFKSDLDLRVYTSRLLGRDPSLVLHGGGNTSVKSAVTNLFGETEDILYVKGSGWDLATIEAAGFAPVKMDMLLKMAKLDYLSDSDMVKYQRAAMIDPSAPNPSVEAILHAIIPFKYVDHTHADAVVTITNTADGEARIKELYGKKVLVIPYIMPGFVLAQLVYRMTKDIDWNELEGMVLFNHGLFTFADDAKSSYEKSIELVDKAEQYLQQKGATLTLDETKPDVDPLKIATLRKEISSLKGHATIVKLSTSAAAVTFAKTDVEKIAQRGPLTPDHVIRTKRIPAILKENFKNELADYVASYINYYESYKKDEICLNPAPNFAIYKDIGAVSFGKNIQEADIIDDISQHTFKAILKAEKLGGYKALDAAKIFEVEYWELEQAKLKKGGGAPEFSGKIAIVTGAASGIGAACAKMLQSKGAAVVALDINPDVAKTFNSKDAVGIVCDLTNEADIQNAVSSTVAKFGGLDIVVSNAGIFTPSETLDVLSESNWEKSMSINLTAHQKLLKVTAPFLKLGIDPAIVMVASKNFPAPGKGAAAYSVAKAGQTQLARIAALELGDYGVRVNTLHPHAVFDTAIWTDEVLQKRAEAYGMTVEQYKTNNVLKTEIRSADVARLVCAMAGDVFGKTTGAQVAIDGGSDRII
ncbi:bifunctional aldolase/short-chain dehydrogenase [Sulfurimonas sp. HSL-1716]|uniref:bifunctional aldolase/short-chain dehydrogenase n=1 Tax=Hydrocurvibacter sulfurireducens TaxID=3131937 RepID=UPI0031F98809